MCNKIVRLFFMLQLLVALSLSQPSAEGNRIYPVDGRHRGLTAVESERALQTVEVDLSAVKDLYTVLEMMREGSSKEDVEHRLDNTLRSRPFALMFRHYNRPWRPNELPPDVFKRMILSLRFPDEYSKGENARADIMLLRWSKFYPDLGPYRRQLHDLETADLNQLATRGAHFAQRWLPPDWHIPSFYLAVIPNGGSPAFTYDGSQGFDFLQLSQRQPIGTVDINWLVGTMAHEAHHLGMQNQVLPAGLSTSEKMAYQIMTICIAEGAATEFVSGTPPNRVPRPTGTRFRVYTPELASAWKKLLPEEEDMIRHQTLMLKRAIAGELTQDDFDRDLREYWLNGPIGRAYVLGADMLGAIYVSFGKGGVFRAFRDPRQFFRLYNDAISRKPRVLAACTRFPHEAVKLALSVGAAPRHDSKQ